MPAIRFNIDVLNAILAGLGGGGEHRRNVAALNEICGRLGGAGGHRRVLAACNEWAVRAGGAGGHRRTLAALNEIDLRLGGTGGHRRSFVALEAIRARSGGPAEEAITSGSVRAQMMSNAGGTYAGGERVTHRQRDRTNVAIARPWFEYFHGRIAATGAVGMELESGLTGGKTNRYRASILTGIAGTAKNQAGATLVRATFFGMDGVDGCTVSGDGFTVTVPNGARFRTDRFELSLPAGAEYFVQTETVAADGSAVGYPIGRYRVPGLGDLSFNNAAASSADLVFARDWTSVWDATPGGALGPVAVLGGGSAPIVVVDGDSIVAEAARPGTGHNSSDVGDAWAVKCFVKRALNAAGYAYLDVSVSGTNVGNFMAGYGKAGLRAALLGYGSAVITDHLHNDRKSGTAFEATGGWTEAVPAAWNNTGLRVRYGWHNAWLRSKLKPGARIVRCTLAPATNSSDGWTSGRADRQERRCDLGGRLCDGREWRPVQAQRPHHAPRRVRRARLRRAGGVRCGLRPLCGDRRHRRRPVAGGRHQRRDAPERVAADRGGRRPGAAAAGAARVLRSVIAPTDRRSTLPRRSIRAWLPGPRRPRPRGGAVWRRAAASPPSRRCRRSGPRSARSGTRPGSRRPRP